MVFNVKFSNSIHALFNLVCALLFTFTFTSGVEAKNKIKKLPPPETMIQCLGQEEHLLHHHRYNGPLYSLNQKLLNALVVASDLDFKSESIRAICNSPDFSPSVGLLRALLLEGSSLYKIDDKYQGARVQKTQIIEVFLQDIPPFLFQYLADVQALLPSANCLNEHIPKLKDFLFEYHYVERESEWNAQLLEKNRLRGIFNGLKKLDKIINICKKKVPTQTNS